MVSLMILRRRPEYTRNGIQSGLWVDDLLVKQIGSDQLNVVESSMLPTSPTHPRVFIQAIQEPPLLQPVLPVWNYLDLTIPSRPAWWLNRKLGLAAFLCPFIPLCYIVQFTIIAIILGGGDPYSFLWPSNITLMLRNHRPNQWEGKWFMGTRDCQGPIALACVANSISSHDIIR